MNKRNLLIIVLVLFTSVFQAQLNAQETSRRITYEAKFTSTQPVIDGFTDPAWDAATEGKMDQIVEGSATTSNGTFKVLWDTENLYMLIQVNDPIRSAWDFESASVNPWMYDNVEIFFGPTNSDSTSYQKGDAQYRFTPGIAGLYNPWSDPRSIDETVVFAEQENTSNYVFEVSWPWAHIVRDSLDLLDDIIIGKIMEFEMQFADNNTIGEPTRANVVAWNNNTTNGNSWNNTDLWGYLKLVGATDESRRITYEANYTSSAPVIDGFTDPVWENAITAKMDQIVEGNATTANGEFKVLWDENNLYFFIQVNDPIRSAWDFESASVNPWMFDNVELFLGPTNNPATAYVKGDAQYRFTPGIAGLYNPWSDPRTIDETVVFAEQENTSNYVFEVSWPWTHIVRDTVDLLPLMTSGRTLEFDIQFADNNTIGEPVRDNVIAWNNSSKNGNAWNNTDLWGFLKLAGAPTSVDNIKNIASIKVYPNPAKNYIRIESSSLFSEIFISNMLGQTVMHRNFEAGEFNTSIDISSLEKDGLYFLNIITETGRESRRFVVIK